MQGYMASSVGETDRVDSPSLQIPFKRKNSSIGIVPLPFVGASSHKDIIPRIQLKRTITCNQNSGSSKHRRVVALIASREGKGG